MVRLHCKKKLYYKFAVSFVIPSGINLDSDIKTINSKLALLNYLNMLYSGRYGEFYRRKKARIEMKSFNKIVRTLSLLNVHMECNSREKRESRDLNANRTAIVNIYINVLYIILRLFYYV
jgi:hypothetical protein